MKSAAERPYRPVADVLLKELSLWFLPTSDWDDLIKLEGLEMGQRVAWDLVLRLGQWLLRVESVRLTARTYYALPALRLGH